MGGAYSKCCSFRGTKKLLVKQRNAQVSPRNTISLDYDKMNERNREL